MGMGEAPAAVGTGPGGILHGMGLSIDLGVAQAK